PLAMRHRANDARELSDTVGQRRRPRLQDQRALHLVELIVDHGAHLAPTRSRDDLLPRCFSPTPARDHCFRITRSDRLWRKNPSRRALLAPRLAADVFSSHELHELGDPTNAAD